MTDVTEDNLERRVEIYQGETGEVVFDVDAKEETIWATQAQIAQLFGVAPQNITYHIRNIYKDGELEENPSLSKMETVQNHNYADDEPTSAKNAQVRSRTIKKNLNVQNRTCKEILQVQNDGGRIIRRRVKVYNLDMIISVGYRVNSKKATKFRVWATSVLRQYLTSGVVVNERRLLAMREKKEVQKLHDVEDMMALVRRLTTRNELSAGEANGVLEVISKYAGSFQTLEEYDDGFIDLSFMSAKKRVKELTIEMCKSAVEQLRASVKGSDLFGKEQNGSFEGNLATIFQSFDGKELYPSVPEKAAHLLYFVIKDHPFYDGNKRIGALLFILFLTLNDCHLTKNGETKISDRALTAIALLIAESEPKEKTLIVSLVCKLLD
ncbi:type II toxin-antitoxin system death-on-curing family toxin [Candidatus Saccharibacteria bacterium]|nr:type II toxin-antitoxin system death-on-curing family toxin [Candidatus Saccharibacteria bacterium]